MHPDCHEEFHYSATSGIFIHRSNGNGRIYIILYIEALTYGQHSNLHTHMYHVQCTCIPLQQSFDSIKLIAMTQWREPVHLYGKKPTLVHYMFTQCDRTPRVNGIGFQGHNRWWSIYRTYTKSSLPSPRATTSRKWLYTVNNGRQHDCLYHHPPAGTHVNSSKENC